jgi:hypothetical protein
MPGLQIFKPLLCLCVRWNNKIEIDSSVELTLFNRTRYTAWLYCLTVELTLFYRTIYKAWLYCLTVELTLFCRTIYKAWLLSSDPLKFIFVTTVHTNDTTATCMLD